MDRLNGAFQAKAGANFLKGEVRLFFEELAHLPAVGIKNDGFSATAVMEWNDVPCSAPLYEKLLHHAEGNLEALCDLISGGVTTIIGFEDALP
jgi:hypothetical protein